MSAGLIITVRFLVHQQATEIDKFSSDLLLVLHQELETEDMGIRQEFLQTIRGQILPIQRQDRETQFKQLYLHTPLD